MRLFREAGFSAALTHTVAQTRVAVELAVWRYGWACPLAFAIVLAASGVELAVNIPLVRALNKPSATSPHQTQDAYMASTQADASPSLDSVERIETLLRTEGTFEVQLRRLFALASSHGINFSRGDYQSVYGGSAEPRRVQLTLTASTRYPQLRAFLEDAMRALPAVSLDQLAVKRDKADKVQVEVQMKVTFWLSIETPEQTKSHAQGRVSTTP